MMIMMCRQCVDARLHLLEGMVIVKNKGVDIYLMEANWSAYSRY